MENLTKQQASILSYIDSYQLKQGISPTLQEITLHLHLKSVSTIHQHIEVLRQKGYITKKFNKSRSVKIMNTSNISTRTLPLLGIIAAGAPIEAVVSTESFDVPAHLVTSESNFVLKVRGSSMIEDGILDGDYVIVERNFYPQNGDVVVALIGNEDVTLKKYYREKTRIRLQPANSSMAPIFVKNPAIQGIVKAIIRKF